MRASGIVAVSVGLIAFLSEAYCGGRGCGYRDVPLRLHVRSRDHSALTGIQVTVVSKYRVPSQTAAADYVSWLRGLPVDTPIRPIPLSTTGTATARAMVPYSQRYGPISGPIFAMFPAPHSDFPEDSMLLFITPTDIRLVPLASIPAPSRQAIEPDGFDIGTIIFPEEPRAGGA